MKKFLSLIAIVLFVASVFAQQSNSSQSAGKNSNTQTDNAPQASAEPAPVQDATPQAAPTQAAPTQAAPAQEAPAESSTPGTATGQSAITQAATAGSAQDDKVLEEIVARVNNAIITRADLRRNQEQVVFDAREQNLSQTQVQERQANALRDLIDQQLLVQRAAELGISADADLVKRLDEIRKQMKVDTLEELQKAAESQGVHWEEFKKRTKETILTQKVIGSEVGARIQITREDVQKYYDEHKADFTQPERVRLSEILIANDPTAPKGSPMEASPEQVAAAEAKIKELHQRLTSGAKFEELARKESNGPTAEQGGDLGYFKRNDLAKTLEEQTFKLKAGEITPPIHTRQGFIILRVNDHIEAGTPPFERVRDQIQERLYMERVQPALREYLVKLRDDAYIDVRDGYSDSGASPNQSKLIYATDSGPRTKQVRGKLGMGKKKTVVVVGNEKSKEAQAASPSGSTSALGQAKAEAVARDTVAETRKSAGEAAAAKAAAEAAEQEKMSHMSNNEKKRYLAEKKKREEKEAKEEAKQKRKEEQEQKELAAKEAQRQAAEAKAAKNKKPAVEKPAAEAKVAKNKKSAAEKPAAEAKVAKNKKPEKSEKKSKEAASAKTSEEGKASEQAESSQPPEKKKIHWF